MCDIVALHGVVESSSVSGGAARCWIVHALRGAVVAPFVLVTESSTPRIGAPRTQTFGAVSRTSVRASRLRDRDSADSAVLQSNACPAFSALRRRIILTRSFANATTPAILCGMPLRAFYDKLGVHWEVWEAHAALEERRSVADRRDQPRGAEDRRERSPAASARTSPVDEGWLVFRSDHARRRHIPIPPAWDRMRNDELEGLMTAARPSGPRSRISE